MEKCYVRSLNPQFGDVCLKSENLRNAMSFVTYKSFNNKNVRVIPRTNAKDQLNNSNVQCR